MTRIDLVLLGLGLAAAPTLVIAIVAAVILEMLSLREYVTWVDVAVFAGLVCVVGYIIVMAVCLFVQEPWLFS